ncbi:hypothetical protein [Mucilaginibacter jinjuensis]|uniref:3-keto-disaccharide hydrolase domain-containing protein n=1 Tax=Mucilaginibacter jinjuensis TaxID=1176721 RepID=A0ABY7T3Q3_9SPHI|nr:hypothetical protein [Mucilaginibacter jinjuensis]WCT10961.1 hypothetical protein PQO05_19680 [Mucilaginibacter jinjuensis]
MKFKIQYILPLCLISLSAFSQMSTKVDLLKQSREKKINIFNRHGGVLKSIDTVMYLDEQADVGIAWLNSYTFTNGTIEFDMKGKDVLQQSFVGIAFHATDEHTYDAIYFRPFNFKADDAVRKSHAVQYISIPNYDWPVLREKFPNKYEQPLESAPEPNNWFHVKIIVQGVTISVYVNHNTKAALTVQQLARLNGTRIGFWAGNGSEGEWKNLTITQ